MRSSTSTIQANPALAAVIADIQQRVLAWPQCHGGTELGCIATGWGEIDDQLGGGLVRGCVHEWLGLDAGLARASLEHWLPPLGVVMHLARQALTRPGVLVWIGRRCWANPAAIARCAIEHTTAGTFSAAEKADRPDRARESPLPRSVFVDPADFSQRVWAIDVALRCRGVSAVIADGSGVGMTESRRFQLAAAGSGVMGLLVRPGWELKTLSASRTRWRVLPAPIDIQHGAFQARWSVELLRCKGMRPADEGARTWLVQTTNEPGAVHLAHEAADRRAEPTPPHRRTA